MNAHPDLSGFGVEASDAGGRSAEWCCLDALKGTVDY
jgi:hypothetical protein